MNKYYVSIIFLSILIGCSSTKKVNNSKFDNMKVDSVFESYFSFINKVIEDSLFLNDSEENNKKFNYILDFFEEISEIPSQRRGTFLGWIYVQPFLLKEDFEKWKNWYYENKGKLRWDDKSKTVRKLVD